MTLDATELDQLTDTLRKTMTATPAADLPAALTALGWPEMLTDLPDVTIPLVFRLLGETGAHAPLINDVLLAQAGLPADGILPLPYAGGGWVIWERVVPPGPVRPSPVTPSTGLDGDLLLHRLEAAPSLSPNSLSRGQLAAGHRALGWWLLGTSRAMLTLARTHAVDRIQFGRPLASFQAVRHRLAETLVAIEGAEATLRATTDSFGALDDFGCQLAKAAAGAAALTAARHCQQVLGGIGFTAEHDLHRHVRRALVLDGLLGSSRELTRQIGAQLRATGSDPRLINL